MTLLETIRNRFRPRPAQISRSSPSSLQGTLLEAFREAPNGQISPLERAIGGWSGWTEDAVQNALDAQTHGNLRESEQLLQMLAKYPPFLHGMTTRVEAVASIPIALEHPDGLPEGPFNELVDHLPELWGGDMATAHGLAVGTKYRVALGAAPCWVRWALSPTGMSWVPQVIARSAGGLRYDHESAKYEWRGKDTTYMVEPNGKNWLLFRGLSGLYPHQYGLIRALAGPIWFAMAAMKLWWTYSKNHGIGQRKVMVPAQMRQAEDFKDLLTVVRDMMGGSVIPCPQYADGTGFNFELVEAKYSTYETFPALLDYVQQWTTLCWLGALDNTQGGSEGSRARAQVHERVSLRYLHSDCDATEAGLRVLFRQWCRYNQIDPRLAPVPHLLWQPPADEEAEAKVSLTQGQALEKKVAASIEIEARGAKVDWVKLAEEHGVPLL